MHVKEDLELEKIKRRKLMNLLTKPERKIHLQVFMLQSSCCPGESCGPAFQDPTSRLITYVRELTLRYKDEVTAEAINVLHPIVRTRHSDVIDRVKMYGVDALPILKVDGEILLSGNVPDREGFFKMIGRRLEGLGVPL